MKKHILQYETYLNLGLAIDIHDGERPMLHVALDCRVVEVAANKALRVENRVAGVHGDLGKRSIANKTLAVGESDIAGRCSVSLVVCDNLDLTAKKLTEPQMLSPFRAGKHQHKSMLYQDQFQLRGSST